MDGVPAFPPALGLAPEQVAQVVRLAGRAPSLHNRQPWLFRVTADVIELHADLSRRMPGTDPEDRELRLGCGAALYDLRLALEHVGVRPLVTLLPSEREPELLAQVRRGGSVRVRAEQSALLRAITARRTNRRPFLATPVPKPHRTALVGSVSAEHSWLHVVDRPQRAELLGLVRRAHDRQLRDEAFRAEMAAWTGLPDGAAEGVQAASAGPTREPQDEWVLRDYSGGRDRPRVPGKDFEDDPLMLVLCSYGRGRQADLEAGEALQRLLLTATSLGLAASMLSQVIEVRETRGELRALLGGTLEPQAVLRIGYGTPVPATPRRAPEDTLLTAPRPAVAP
ncbi:MULTISPECIES: nitroreductase family protein [Saccharopolyspora]|uniref:Acg family FMN-binding oxidoreductase n=1 Tax=Saccharopolyspora TaxID=1835 RepID=UPI001CD6BB5E|nr:MULTISPECIES: nitroreductase family protein [Saccharopolyspora]MCA1194977.1 nitroreductase family protein [Saccharopolyspora sp. 6V]MCA1227601.1 nitroreductase family protein [Saccharopolyspora sp. 6M]MCA1281739.1 nitroreductase family protein [Saccharopolyspora sp. 7B]